MKLASLMLVFFTISGYFSVFASDDRPAVSLKTVGIIKRFEGFRSSVYLDSARRPTIGYGHLITSSDGDLATRVLSEDEAQSLLMADIQIKADISPHLRVTLNENQFDALTSLCFNIGYGNFSKSTVLQKVNVGQIVEAYEYFGHWRRAGGAVIDGLMKRRFAELFIFADKSP